MFYHYHIAIYYKVKYSHNVMDYNFFDFLICNMDYKFFDGFFIINKYGKILFI